MPINIRGESDKIIKKIVAVLKKYQAANERAEIDVYRQSNVSVRIRIVDPSFDGLDKPERHTKVWQYLEQLPEEVQSDITMLLLLTPNEKQSSFANFEFEDPIPATL